MIIQIYTNYQNLFIIMKKLLKGNDIEVNANHNKKNNDKFYLIMLSLIFQTILMLLKIQKLIFIKKFLTKNET